MNKILHAISTLTDRYQTTIPESVRLALHLEKCDKIEYTIDDHGHVILSRFDEDGSIASQFLIFTDNDIKSQHIKAIDSMLLKRANTLVEGVDVDLDKPLDEKDG